MFPGYLRSHFSTFQCFTAGIVLFSGSCYAVGLKEDRSLGKLAPIGGFGLIGGWLSLALLRR